MWSVRATLDHMCAPDSSAPVPQGGRSALDRRTLLAAGTGALVLGGASVLRPASARAATLLGETTAGVDTIAEALAAAATEAWGGHQNGRVPSSALVPVTASVAGSGFLRDDAARQFLALSVAFRAGVGRTLAITEGYRSYDRQVQYWNAYQAGKGNLAAYPGTSNHGWGISCDFGSGVETYGSAAKRWMDANAPAYGWSPTGNGFSQREAWHFDFVTPWAGPQPVVAERTGLLVVRCTETLDGVGAGYVALLGMRSLRHLTSHEQINALRLAGVPFHEVPRSSFLGVMDALSIPRSALAGNADHWRP